MSAPETPVSNIIDNWLEYRSRMCALGRIMASTYQNQREIAHTLQRGIGATPLADFRKSHIDLWLAERLQTCKPVTVQAELQVLRQILNWAVDEQVLQARPRFPTISVPNTERALPSDDDFTWYLVNLPLRHAKALEFMLLTGLAPHELARLQACDYRPADQAIEIGGRADFAVKQPSRRRQVPLNFRAQAVWVESSIGLSETGAVFPSVEALQKAMRRLFLSAAHAPAAADGLTPKMMRKWFASKIAVEHSEAVLQRLLGHAPGSKVTRRHYVRSNEEQLRKAVQELMQ